MAPVPRSPASIAALAALLAAGCAKPPSGPGEPVAGIYAVRGAGALLRGSAKKPLVRRARAGMLLTTAMTLDTDRGAVLEAFDGSFVFVPAGKHTARSLGLEAAPAEPGKRHVVRVKDRAERKVVPAPAVVVRYEPLESGKPLKDEESAQFQNDMAYFFLPHGEKEPDPHEQKPPAPPPWMQGEAYVHPLRRPLRPGDGARALTSCKGVVVVEFADRATAFADALPLPLDLADVSRVVVADGSAKLSLPEGSVEVKAGEVAEILPLEEEPAEAPEPDQPRQ
jgi:hypothetical protein